MWVKHFDNGQEQDYSSQTEVIPGILVQVTLSIIAGDAKQCLAMTLTAPEADQI